MRTVPNHVERRRLMLTPIIAGRYIEEHEEYMGVHPPKTRDDPRQRKVLGAAKIYASLMTQGRFRHYIPDPILRAPACICAHPIPHRFLINGLQRCWAVFTSEVPIGVEIDEEADPALFPVIDIGATRRPSQFVQKKHASLRSATARVIYWYDNLFSKPLAMRGSSIPASMEEVIDTMIQYEDLFDALIVPAGHAYERTGIFGSVILASLTIAHREGYGPIADDFISRVANPVGLDPSDPAWMLVEKMSRRHERNAKRTAGEAWTLFVRCLNADITGVPLPTKLYINRIAWPRIGESESDFNRRINNSYGKKKAA